MTLSPSELGKKSAEARKKKHGGNFSKIMRKLVNKRWAKRRRNLMYEQYKKPEIEIM